MKFCSWDGNKLTAQYILLDSICLFHIHLFRVYIFPLFTKRERIKQENSDFIKFIPPFKRALKKSKPIKKGDLLSKITLLHTPVYQFYMLDLTENLSLSTPFSALNPDQFLSLIRRFHHFFHHFLAVVGKCHKIHSVAERGQIHWLRITSANLHRLNQLPGRIHHLYDYRFGKFIFQLKLASSQRFHQQLIT